MNEPENNIVEKTELPDSWWYKVYAAVALTTILVIFALWMFSQYFK
jgi:hypothetical protein